MRALFNIDSEASGGRLSLSLSGEFDIAGIERFEEALNNAGDTLEQIVIDLRELRFIDSSGIRALLMADKLAKERGASLTIVKPAGTAQKVLELSGVSERLTLVGAPDQV